MHDQGDATAVAGQRVLVTGAAGFIGSALCRALLRYGAEVHGISRTPKQGNGLRWWQADLSQAETVRDVLARVRPTTVFHLASHVSGNRALDAVLPTIRDNLLTTVNLLTAACETGRPRVVLAGSMEECDPSEPEAVPVSPYAAAKTAAGTYARLFHGMYGLPVVHLRIFMVYGPGQRDTTKLIPYVTTSLLHGERPRLSSGAREIDWVYIDDVVTAFIAAADAPAADGATVDVGSGELISIGSLVTRLVDVVGSELQPLFGALEDRPVEHRRLADVTRTSELIGWKAETSLDSGLKQTVTWFRERDRQRTE